MEISTILITLVVLIVLFLIFREINLWYFKINERIEIANKQTMLLEIIAEHLAGDKYLQSLDAKKSFLDQKNSTDNVVSENDIIDPEVFSTLTESKKHIVNNYIDHGLTKGNKLVINKKSRKFNSFDINDWDKILRNSKQDEWLIISENKFTQKS